MLAQRCTSKSIPLKQLLQSHLRVHLSSSLWIALYYLSREYQVQITLRSFVFFLKKKKKIIRMLLHQIYLKVLSDQFFLLFFIDTFAYINFII